jgi:hypothetical protein
MTVGDRVWLDENSDGVQDAGEAGIANVVVQLYDACPARSCWRDRDRQRRQLPVHRACRRAYVVRIDTQRCSRRSGRQPDLRPRRDRHRASNGRDAGGGESRFDADFGYNWSSTAMCSIPDAEATGAIGDRVWIDANGDGVQDPGEPGLGGVTVAIYYDSNGDGTYDALYTAA